MLHRTRTWVHFALTVVVLLSLSVVSAQDAKPEAVGLRPDAPTYALHGPYWVGTMEFTIPDKDGKRPLPLTIWYPALNSSGAAESITYTYDPGPSLDPFSLPGEAIDQAAPNLTNGPYPLIIFSHGNVGFRYFSSYLTEHLASYGFVVLAADHTGNTIGYSDDLALAGEDGSGTAESTAVTMAYRPGDIQSEIDYAAYLTAKDGALPNLIDMEHIGVVGYSYGGFTALASAGARVDFTPLHSWCKQNENDPAVNNSVGFFIQCVFIAASEDKIKEAAGVTVGTGEMWPAFDVKGVDAIVPLAPLSVVFTSGGAKSVTVPTLMIAGSGDTLLPIDFNAAAVYKELSSTNKSLVLLDHANHGIFANKTDDYLMKHGWFDYTSDSIWDMDRAHDLTNHFTTAFLLDILKGDKEAAKALAPDAINFPGIEYKAEGF